MQIPSPLRPLTGGAEEVQVEAGDVGGADRGPGERAQGPARDRLLDAAGNLRSYVRIFVNDEDVRFLDDKQTPLKRRATSVAIVPAIAGGL